MRGVVALVVLGLVSASAAATAENVKPTRYVNLNASGVLDKLRESNSAHYAKIQKILAGLDNRSGADVPYWMHTKFRAKNVGYSPYLLTTSPPQRDLSFVLGNTEYSARVTLMPGTAMIFPMKGSPNK